MLGHILRRDENTPAQLALYFAVDADTTMKGRVGRHQKNLFRILKEDLKKRKFLLNCVDNLESLKVLASDRMKWRRMQQFSV